MKLAPALLAFTVCAASAQPLPPPARQGAHTPAAEPARPASGAGSEAPAGCAPPPVASAAAAICLVSAAVARKSDGLWETVYEAVEEKGHWIVVYRPKDLQVRGGGGKCQVDMATGELRFFDGYR